MTIEEYVALKAAVLADDVVILGFTASPSHVWSEWTSEDFSATLNYRLKSVPNSQAAIYLDEDDICEFLNTLYPTQERG